MSFVLSPGRGTGGMNWYFFYPPQPQTGANANNNSKKLVNLINLYLILLTHIHIFILQPIYLYQYYQPAWRKAAKLARCKYVNMLHKKCILNVYNNVYIYVGYPSLRCRLGEQPGEWTDIFSIPQTSERRHRKQHTNKTKMLNCFPTCILLHNVPV